jgi:hypothetical protein
MLPSKPIEKEPPHSSQKCGAEKTTPVKTESAIYAARNIIKVHYYNHFHWIMIKE